MNWIVVGAVLGIMATVFVMWLAIQLKSGKKLIKSSHIGKSKPEEVRAFYNDQTENFLKVYGEVIQAFRTTDVSKLLDYQIESIGFEEGWKVLDAGCGVCGPARYFAKTAKVEVDAVTISDDQVNRSIDLIKADNQEGSVRVHHGDYHYLESILQPETYNAVYFLESFGHAQDQAKVLDSAWNMLKPGGTLYIKDLFLKEGAFPGHEKAIKAEADNINAAYRYNISDLYYVLRHLRKSGFIISFVKTIDLKLEEFENLTISNDFQELTGINKIENLRDYVFPVDFFEIKCFKPWTNVMEGNSRYFLQNLYFMQVEGWKKEQL
ncbi:MAG: ubiquinone/menaquinone biosynthesis C-methylase UbiE [Flavobacteriales bacterium]|jgi:ubiquinone/menaquinone biosynthesis C-methylase UbiE